jgi:hypothetical protein
MRSPLPRGSLRSPLKARLNERGRNSIHQGESCQAPWLHREAYLLVLTQEAKFPLTLAFCNY